MVHRKVLEQNGCTVERLREIFTAPRAGKTDKTKSKEDNKRAKKNWEIRDKFEKNISSRMSAGVTECAKRASLWQAVDIAWDSTPIQKETIPLLLWAQKKIKTTELATQLGSLNCAGEYISTEGNEIKVDIPRLYEISINLIRSYVTRRLAAQTTRFSNLWPYFKYQPRGTDMVSKLRGDALSERVDVMVDAYNMRHFFPQTYRHQFLYSRSVVFTREGWNLRATSSVRG